MPKNKRRIQISDLPQDASMKLTEEDMKRVSGGLTLSTSIRRTTPLLYSPVAWDPTDLNIKWDVSGGDIRV